MPFDTNAATQGAMAGTAVYPGIGTAAGFVIGGFLGGSYQSGQKKQRRTLEKKIRRRLDPSYYKKLVQDYTPIARQSVLDAGAGDVIKQEVQGNISRRGLTGTGLGTAFQNAAALAPSNLASQQAQGMATTNLNNELNSIVGMGSYNAPDISTLSRQSAGDIATAIAIFRSLKGKQTTQTPQIGAGQNPDQAPPWGTPGPNWRPGGWNPYNPSDSAMGRSFPGATGY